MSETTNTLQVLRRAVAQELRMDFSRRFPAGSIALITGSTTSVLKANELTQEDNYWAGAWAYHVPSKTASLITASSSSGKTITLEVPLASVSVGDTIEIHNIWNAYDMLSAINRTIESFNRTYFDSVIDETLVVEEKKLRYDLTGLTKKPWVLAAMYVENITSIKRGMAAAGSTTSKLVISESATTISDVNSNWYVSIYAGTGSGQVRKVVSVSGQDITVTSGSTPWTVAPDATSKYALWNPSEQVYDWIPSPEWYLDAKEYPDYLNLKRLYMTNYGLRMRLSYLAVPSTLTNETDTTIVPKELIVLKACSILHGQACNNTKFDHDLHLSEFQRYDAAAADYLNRNTPHKPDILMKSPSAAPSYFEDDPLSWFNNPYSAGR